jgi:hypothetical protein
VSIAVRDLTWAAGILEGEGYFGLRPQGITVALSMTDKDVVDRFHSIFRFGSRKERGLPSGKTAYTWTVTDQADAAGLMMTLFSLMGQRRQARIMECLQAWKDRGPRRKYWEQCSSGHDLSGDNLKVIQEGKYMKRRCIECARLRQQKYRGAASGIFAL